MRKPKRRFWSAVPGVASLIMLSLIDIRALVLLPLMLLGLQFYSMGTVYLALTGIFLVYKDVGGLYGLSTLTLAFLATVMGRLDRERAPLNDYGVVTATGLLVFPTYFLLRALAPLLMGLEATVLAVLLLVAMYFFIKVIAS